ncbi:MAG: VOC family protein [Sciscionella sp.]|nr:VOC family protein [Sciscionella sp.]
MTQNPNNPGVWPSVIYPDAEAARKFLTEVFGFTETETVRDADGSKIVHGELRWPEGGGIMYGDAAEDNHPDFPQPQGIQWLYVVTADPDAVHKRAVEAGATIVREPSDTDYGSRDVSIADLAGNVWTFGTYPGAR